MLTNPFTGQTIEFVTDGEELLVMESTYKPGGAPAPAHFHPDQEETFTVLAFRAVFAADELEHLKPESLITAPIWLSRRMEKPLVAYVSGLAGGKARVELWTEGGGGDWRLVDAGEYFELEGGRWTFDWPRLDRRAVADALRWSDRAGVSAAITHEFGVEVAPLWSGPRRGANDKRE